MELSRQGICRSNIAALCPQQKPRDPQDGDIPAQKGEMRLLPSPETSLSFTCQVRSGDGA